MSEARNDDMLSIRRDALAAIRAEGELCRSLAQWLVSLDEPSSTERRTVTLTQIINEARRALDRNERSDEEERG